jgi:RHS repeat-associated protein
MKTIWAALLLAGLLVTPAHSETITYLHTDLLGSVVLETDQNRNVVARYEYEPYGLPRQAVVDQPGYTGHVHDAGSGLVYMQQRYYDPEVGQFLSVDPMPSDTATGWNFNRYNYAANNPYTFVDPDGRMVGEPWKEPWGGRDPWGGPPNDPMGGPCGTGKACWSDDGGQSQGGDQAAPFRSYDLLRSTVPGQVAFDNAVTAWNENRLFDATLFGTSMLGEQVLTVLTVGQSAQVGQLSRSATTQLGNFLGPKGPLLGSSYYRGAGNAGLLNHGPVRFGWSYNQATDRLNLSLRVGNWHSDRVFNPISIRPPPLE